MAVKKRGKYYHTRFQIEGIKIDQSTKCTRLADAKEFERKLRASLKKSKSHGYTINDAAVRWIEEGAPESMRSHINQMLIYMEDTPLENAIEDASIMKAKMLKQGASGKPLSIQTVNRRLSCVRTLLNKAFNEYGMLDMPIASRISKMMGSELEYAREVFLTIDQASELISLMPRENTRNFVLAACATGMRRSELLSLNQDSYKNGCIRLTVKTKGKRSRTIPIPEWAKHCFEVLPFPVTRDMIRWDFEKARVAFGMPTLRLHDLRHTFASWLAENPNVPLTAIKELLGHSNLSVTSKYAHLRADFLKTAVDEMQDPNKKALKTVQKTGQSEIIKH